MGVPYNQGGVSKCRLDCVDYISLELINKNRNDLIITQCDSRKPLVNNIDFLVGLIEYSKT